MIAFIAGHRASQSAASSIAPSTYFKRVAQQRSPTRLSAGAQRDQVPKPEVARADLCGRAEHAAQIASRFPYRVDLHDRAAGGSADQSQSAWPRPEQKHRALLPVLPLLGARLREEPAIYQSLPPDARKGRGWLVTYFNRGIQDVDRAWKTMLINLTCPKSKRCDPMSFVTV